jgi:hypothetical protein
MNEVHVADVCRTTVGNLGGRRIIKKKNDMALQILAAILGRNPSLDPAATRDVVRGAATMNGGLIGPTLPAAVDPAPRVKVDAVAAGPITRRDRPDADGPPRQAGGPDPDEAARQSRGGRRFVAYVLPPQSSYITGAVHAIGRGRSLD